MNILGIVLLFMKVTNLRVRHPREGEDPGDELT
jgi:hypothetical protein